MGIVNVTPDSFSDGNRFFDAQAAIDHALRLADAGAEILDVGGESTRPYSTPVDADEERRRVIPVLEAICSRVEVPVSIDTSKEIVARDAIAAGVEIINDVTGLEGDERMVPLVLQSQVGVCAMHMQGTPQTMQNAPTYRDVVSDIHRYLRERRDLMLAAGIAQNRVCLDPGIGFGKTHEHNIALLANCHRFHDLGCPLLIGHSRKGFIGKLLGNKEADRMAGTLGISIALALKRIQVIRVHDVAETMQALKVFAAIGGLDGDARTHD
ncbi:MAG: dihydropteroate synthase [Planctomycetales bacterium]|nr:dihydropteroate synthase [Planctomycetales bacterium]